MRIPSGSHVSFKKRDSRTGYKMPEMGASQEADSGETESHSGSQMIWKKSFALVLSLNFRSFLDVDHLPISTESQSIILPILQRWAKVFLEESQKFLIAGLRVDLCHSLKVIIHSQSMIKNS